METDLNSIFGEFLKCGSSKKNLYDHAGMHFYGSRKRFWASGMQKSDSSCKITPIGIIFRKKSRKNFFRKNSRSMRSLIVSSTDFLFNFWKNWKKSPWSPFMFFSKIFEKNWRGDQGKFFFQIPSRKSRDFWHPVLKNLIETRSRPVPDPDLAKTESRPNSG